jgi:DNA repair exonuclease SbcCD ATPase subunit
MGSDLRALLRSLFAAPPDEFVAARNALAKQLRTDGDRDTAAAVTALRRPSWPDHVLDVAVDQHPDLVTAFLDAAAVTRDIQDAAVAGRRTGSLPDALRELRAAQSALATAANRLLVDAGRKPDVAGIGERLAEVAANADTAVQLRDGILGAGELVGEGAAPAAPARTERRRSKAKRAASTPDAGEIDAETERLAEERAAEQVATAARQEREAVVRARRESVRLAATADKAVERVTQQRDRAVESVTDAEQALATAQQALDRARSVLDALEDEVAAAESAATTAHAQTAELDERLDELGDHDPAD